MATLTNPDVEAEARAILRETIQRSGWYPAIPKDERNRRIEQDVERHWHLMIDDAVKRIAARARETSTAKFR